MPFQPEAIDLVVADTDLNGREIYLSPAAAHAWREMRDAARNEGVVVLLISGFRSVARQKQIIQSKIQQGVALDEILKVNAFPGFSEHHTGRAIDVSTHGAASLTQEFAKTPAYAWLQAHAASFSFHLSYPEDNASGVIFEPWHWCYRASRGT